MEHEPIQDEYKHHEKMYPSLIEAFNWALGEEYTKSEFIISSILEEIDEEDDVSEVIAESRADTIGEIYNYAKKFKIPSHLIEQAEDIAQIKEN